MFERLGDEYRRFAENVLAALQTKKGGQVLEIGPGPGWAGLCLLEKRPDLRLLGIDASPDMLRAARANAEAQGLGARCEYREGHAETLEGVEAGSVDLVISRDSLHHWDDPAKAFSAIRRVLAPTGGAFIADGRRDLSLGARLFVGTIGSITAGPMAKYWKSSLAAAYTPEELREFCALSASERPGREWRVKEGFLDLAAIGLPLHTAAACR
jgi:ubiquinone/menaquinone biosynthesis C-methylase UbiE